MKLPISRGAGVVDSTGRGATGPARSTHLRRFCNHQEIAQACRAILAETLDLCVYDSFMTRKRCLFSSISGYLYAAAVKINVGASALPYAQKSAAHTPLLAIFLSAVSTDTTLWGTDM